MLICCFIWVALTVIDRGFVYIIFHLCGFVSSDLAWLSISIIVSSISLVFLIWFLEALWLIAVLATTLSHCFGLSKSYPTEVWKRDRRIKKHALLTAWLQGYQPISHQLPYKGSASIVTVRATWLVINIHSPLALPFDALALFLILSLHPTSRVTLPGWLLGFSS